MSEDCPKVREHMDAFVDSELEPERQSWIEEHLKFCNPCLKLSRLIIGVKDRLRRSVKKPAVPRHLRACVLQALDQETGVAAPAGWWPRWIGWLPAQAVALAAVAVLVLTLIGPHSTPSHAYNFTEISRQAYQRMANHEVHPVAMGTEIYQSRLTAAGLAEMQAPSLDSLNYKCRGCCFGLQIGDRPVAHYVYSSGDGSEVSLLMWKRNSSKDKITGVEKEFAGRRYILASQDGVPIVLWENGDVYCSMMGQKSEERLIEMASIVRS